MTDQSVSLRAAWPDHGRQGGGREAAPGPEQRQAPAAGGAPDRAARGDPRGRARGVLRARLCGDPARRRRAARRRRQGHDLSLLPRQGEPVPGTRARDAEPDGRHDRGRADARSADPRRRRSHRRPVRARDLRHAPQGRDPADHHRGAALPQARRVLLSRGDRARARRRCARCCSARGRARRAVERRAGALSATAGRARRWSRSSGTACSTASRRSTSRELMRAHLDLLFGERNAS